MKKGQIISLALGAAALAAGAAAYTAAKLAGEAVPSRHDPKDQVLNTPYVPDENAAEEPAEEQEAQEEEPEQAEEQASTAEEPEAEPEQAEPDSPFNVLGGDTGFASYAEEAPEVTPDKAQEETPEEALAEAPEGVQEVPAPVDLEQYMYINPEKMESLNVVKDSFAAEGVKTDISFTDNTMFFDFVMTDVDDEETDAVLKPDLELFLEDQTEVYRNIIKQLEDDSGFNDIKMIVIFMDASENEIVSGHYDETGKTM